MDRDLYLSNGNVEELVKTSKQMQNKMRQELRQQSMISTFAAYGDKEGLPPIWDRAMHSPYVKNMVADYLLDSSKLISKSTDLEIQSDVKQPLKKANCLEESYRPTLRTPATKINVLRANKSTASSRKVFTVVGTEVTPQHNQFTLDTVKSKVVGTPVSHIKNVKTLKPISKSGPLETDKGHRESYRSPNKPSANRHRFPLRRFVGCLKRDIDFFQEHPNLELDMSFNQTTLFPRRFHRKTHIPLRTPPEIESINLAGAKINPPILAAVNQETWKEVLLKNQTHKVLRLKKNVEDIQSSKIQAPPLLTNQTRNVNEVESFKKVQEHEVKEPKGLDIISTSANGLFLLEKQTKQLSRQRKCNLQRFPVMYIRPECQVQRVANISIPGGSEVDCIHTAAENVSTNVKYIECVHEEEKLYVSCSPRKKTDAVKNEQRHVTSKIENKFFKALEFELLKNSAVRSNSTASTSRTCSSSKCSRSSSIVQQFSGQQSIKATENDVHHIIQEIVSSLDESHAEITKDLSQNRLTQRAVYVQTDKEIRAISPSPLPSSPQKPRAELNSSIPNAFCTPYPYPVAACRRITKQEDDNFIEEDLITKIFDRIRNDVPNALQAFKDLNTTPRDAVHHLSSPTIKQHQKQMQEHHHQTAEISKSSNVKLLSNKIESRLSSFKAKKQDSHTILLKPPSVDSPVTTQSSPVGDVGCSFLLLQQNPLFVQTINRIKSSAVHDVMPGDGITEDRHKYPTDAEIKRAVKIFLDLLKLDGIGGGCISSARKSVLKVGSIRKKFILSRPELISSGRVTNYSSTSSSTSNTTTSSKDRNVKGRNNNFYFDGVTSSTSTSVSFLDPESDVTEDTHHQLSTKITMSNLSEGEVLSIGEV